MPGIDIEAAVEAAAAGLTQFGLRLMHPQPGQRRSRWHWHTAKDEFWVAKGEVVMVSSYGNEVRRSGDSAGFAVGIRPSRTNSNREAVPLEIESRSDRTHSARTLPNRPAAR
jgi:uncharacterized cupin superfamily protein